MLSKSERSLRARRAAEALHAAGGTNMGPAWEARDRRFLDQVDPERKLPEDVRLKRAAWARKAFYTGLAYQSVKARRLKRERAERETRGE